jgi:hypothetical protein
MNWYGFEGKWPWPNSGTTMPEPSWRDGETLMFRPRVERSATTIVIISDHSDYITEWAIKNRDSISGTGRGLALHRGRTEEWVEPYLRGMVYIYALIYIYLICSNFRWYDSIVSGTLAGTTGHWTLSWPPPRSYVFKLHFNIILPPKLRSF